MTAYTNLKCPTFKEKDQLYFDSHLRSELLCNCTLTTAFSNLSRSLFLLVSPVLSCPLALFLLSNSVLWLSLLQMDVVYTFQTGQAAVPGALRRQPSVVSQHNDATAAKTLSSPTHVGLSSSSSLTNSAGAPPPAAASSSTAGSESVTGGQLTAHLTGLDSFSLFETHCMTHWTTAAGVCMSWSETPDQIIEESSFICSLKAVLTFLLSLSW